MARYYILRERFVLRGWQHASGILIRRPTNVHKVLKATEFQTLLLCDGQSDFEASYITDEMRELAVRMEKRNIIRACDKDTELTEDQRYRYYDNRFVSHAMWSVTGCCNFRCRHCYMDAPEGVLGQLSTERALQIIDEMAECGILRVQITGGEPLIRPDFWQVIDRLLLHKIDVQAIFTNGALLTGKMLDGFEARSISPQFTISFDGLGWHDWMRGKDGAEKLALNAMERAAQRGYIVNASICVHKGNLPVLWETIEKLADIGIRMISCSGIDETELWKKNGNQFKLSQAEWIEGVLPLIDKFYQNGMPVDLKIGNVIMMKKESVNYHVLSESYPKGVDCSDCYLCNEARFSTYIAPDGQLLPCLPMTGASEKLDFRFPSLGDITLKEGLSDSVYLEFITRRIRELFCENSKCGSCRFRMRCGGGCRAEALLESGNLMGPDLTKCFLFENGYPERIRECAEKAINKYVMKETVG